MPTLRRFYQGTSLFCGPSPATGYHFSSGNSGANFIQSLARIQSANDSFSNNRENAGQFGQISILDRLIVAPPSVPLEFTYNQADLNNERILGLYVSGSQGALSLILNGTQADKNYWIGLAPVGVDEIGYTGQVMSKYITNGYLSSYSTEGAVGGFPTTTVGIQGFNWESSTGSVLQPLRAIDPLNNTLTTGVLFTLPTASSGLANSVAVIRPSEITANLSNTIGYVASDLHLQRYSVSFGLNNQPLTQLGQFYPYGIVPQFPVTVNASVTANWGDITTGSLANLICNDNDLSLTINLYKPACLGQPRGTLAASYTLVGAKIDSQAATMNYGDVTSPLTLSFTTTIGGPNDTVHNLFMSGISV